MGLLAQLGAEPGVVGGGSQTALGELGRELLGGTSGGDVDEPRTVQLDHLVDDRTTLVRLLDVAHDVEADVRAVIAVDEQNRILQAEALDDLLAHRGRSGCREGEHSRARRRPGDRADRVPEPQVVGSEIVAPRRDAVGLIHDEQRDLELGQTLDDLVASELLGGEEDVLRLPVGELLPGGGVGLVRLGRVHRDGVRGIRPRANARDLIRLKCDERRHDDGQPLEQRTGDLVDRRLSVARRHDGHDVVSGEELIDRGAQPGPQLRPAEGVRRDAGNVGGPAQLRCCRRVHAALGSNRPSMFQTVRVRSG